MRSYEITPTAAAIRLKLYEDGIEMGGDVFPIAASESAATAEATDEGKTRLISATEG